MGGGGGCGVYDQGLWSSIDLLFYHKTCRIKLQQFVGVPSFFLFLQQVNF